MWDVFLGEGGSMWMGEEGGERKWITKKKFFKKRNR